MTPGVFTHSDIRSLYNNLKGYENKAPSNKEKEKEIQLLFRAAKQEYIDHWPQWKFVPLLKNKPWAVYCPEDLPVILTELSISISPDSKLKDSNLREKAAKKRDNAEKIQEFCREKGFTHLSIPRMQLNKKDDYLIEERLPRNPDEKDNIGFYLEHKERFGEAVKEFTELFINSNLADLKHYLSSETDYSCELGNYRAISFYLEEGEVKIGLLKTFKLIEITDAKGNFNSRDFAIPLSLFPCHWQEIVEVAKKYSLEKEMLRIESFEAFANRTLETYQAIYGDHSDLLKKNKITLENYLELPLIDEKSLCIKVQEDVVIWLKKEGIVSTFNRAIKYEPNPDQPLFENVFQDCICELLNIMRFFISTKLKEAFNRHEPQSFEELVSKRSLVFDHKDPEYIKLQRKFFGHLAQVLNRDFLIYSCDDKLHLILIDLLFQELLEAGGLDYYNPTFGRERNKICIFC